MPKFELSASKYAKFWDSRDAASALRIFLNDPDIIQRKHTFWETQFSVNPLLATRGADGTAIFKQSVTKNSIDNMLDMRAPLGETQPRDKKGIDFYVGSIPDFAAKGYVETAMEREARERMFAEYFGNDAQILAAYASEVQSMVDEGHSTISNLAAQLLSTGAINYTYGTGIQGLIQKAPIPAANFKTAGAVVWSAANCKLIDQMAKIEQDFREANAYAGPMKWSLPLAMFNNVFLKNAQVIEYVASWRVLNDKAMPVNGMAINEAMFLEAFKDNNLISPIEIVREGQRDGSVGAVHGWSDNVAVLRPAGFAGELQRASVADVAMVKKYGSSVINEVYTNLDIFTICNTTLNNGRLKEWHTDLLVSCVPALYEWPWHVIVDTATADA